MPGRQHHVHSINNLVAVSSAGGRAGALAARGVGVSAGVRAGVRGVSWRTVARGSGLEARGSLARVTVTALDRLAARWALRGNWGGQLREWLRCVHWRSLAAGRLLDELRLRHGHLHLRGARLNLRHLGALLLLGEELRLRGALLRHGHLHLRGALLRHLHLRGARLHLLSARLLHRHLLSALLLRNWSAARRALHLSSGSR